MNSIDFDSHFDLISSNQTRSGGDQQTSGHSLETTPIFSAKAWRNVNVTADGSAALERLQHGLLGLRLQTYEGSEQADSDGLEIDNLVYANITCPWSAFICGSQGSGKSHTLSCLLENAIISGSKAGNLANPLAAIVFHYDKFTGYLSSQLCEAAYLCSAGIPVRILVSPSNFSAMDAAYRKMPGPKPKIVPMYFQQKDLNISMMKTLMAVGGGDGSTPLYMEVVMRILREMAKEATGQTGINYASFKYRLNGENLMKGQNGPLKMRLQLLESFLDLPGLRPAKETDSDLWDFKSGTLTIVDLSCPFVAENDACALFNICLSLFLERRHQGGRLVALDEAHKFLTTNSREATEFTDTLLAVIRQQRHLATRVVIATQEPTLSPSLLDLSNVTIVHRFTSPAWYKILEGHLAAALIGKRKESRKKQEDDSGYQRVDLFEQIVHLGTGEALVFCPTALLDVVPSDVADANGIRDTETYDEVVQELGARYIKMKVRNRLTTDGGQSILSV
ncbi:hypothetical protein V8E54_008103 [Elaphomyces granulatus]